jgi:hypothetical protein
MSRTPYDDREWHEFVRNVRESAVKQIESSAFVMSLVPDDDEPDIKFAVELGLSIMFNKPLLIVAARGRDVPDRLRRVADEVVEVDLDTEAGAAELSAAISRIHEASA